MLRPRDRSEVVNPDSICVDPVVGDADPEQDDDGYESGDRCTRLPTYDKVGNKQKEERLNARAYPDPCARTDVAVLPSAGSRDGERQHQNEAHLPRQDRGGRGRGCVEKRGYRNDRPPPQFVCPDDHRN